MWLYLRVTLCVCVCVWEKIVVLMAHLLWLLSHLRNKSVVIHGLLIFLLDVCPPDCILKKTSYKNVENLLRSTYFVKASLLQILNEWHLFLTPWWQKWLTSSHTHTCIYTHTRKQIQTHSYKGTHVHLHTQKLSFRLVFMTRIRRVALTKSSLLLKIKWKHHHYLYRKWAELLSGTESHVTMSDVGKSKREG